MFYEVPPNSARVWCTIQWLTDTPPAAPPFSHIRGANKCAPSFVVPSQDRWKRTRFGLKSSIWRRLNEHRSHLSVWMCPRISAVKACLFHFIAKRNGMSLQSLFYKSKHTVSVGVGALLSGSEQQLRPSSAVSPSGLLRRCFGRTGFRAFGGSSAGSFCSFTAEVTLDEPAGMIRPVLGGEAYCACRMSAAAFHCLQQFGSCSSELDPHNHPRVVFRPAQWVQFKEDVVTSSTCK